MEITFNAGLDDLGNQILENKKNKDETVWEKHLRKKKDKKELFKREKELRKLNPSDDFLLNDDEMKKY